MKKDDSLAVRVEDEDIAKFQELAATVGSVDQILSIHSGKMPKRDMVAVIGERNKAAVELEKFVAGIYKKYGLDDGYNYAFDVARAEIHQMPTKRPLWRFRIWPFVALIINGVFNGAI